MAANQQLSVPVWDAHADAYMGMLTVTDLVEIVLACRSSKSYNSCLEGLKVCVGSVLVVGSWISQNLV
jgi:hypothetical protein